MGKAYNQEVLKKLRSILIDLTNIKLPFEKINNIYNIDEFNLDSMQVVEFILKVEERFNFTFEESDINLELVKDLRKLAGYIEIHMTI